MQMDLNRSYTYPLVIVLAIVLALLLLYRRALPKPFPGIPYDVSSSKKLLGDVPAMMSHIEKDQGTFTTYLISQMKSLNAPMIQVFIRPFSKPLLVMGDFPEAHDMLIHRKEFDRSSTLGDLVYGLAPDHHIHLKTNNAWKAQRRLVQDLMTPSFLHKVAAPVIYRNVNTLIQLWRTKARIADGKPWPAGDDINLMSLDAVTAFAFGAEFDHNATRPSLDLLTKLEQNAEEIRRPRGSESQEEPLAFPRGKVDGLLQAILDLTQTVGEVQGNPSPSLTWAYVMRKPRIKRAAKTKDAHWLKELKGAVERFDGVTKGTPGMRSAVDQMVLREKGLAEKENRPPNYFSRIMIDELFGFIFAGHETTSTTICWGLKFLTDNPATQAKLRQALRSAFQAAEAEGRDPTAEEITATHIPYLEAAMEEMLRCASTAPVVDRQAMTDTEILGYHIPKGTVVSCLVAGPTMMSPGFEINKRRRHTGSQTTRKEGRDRAWDSHDISQFKPERWLIQGEKGDKFDATAGPQLAFGLGTRGCYGKRLVYVEMKILLTVLLWRFEFLSCPPELSSYKSRLIVTNEPRSCYVRLRELTPRSES